MGASQGDPPTTSDERAPRRPPRIVTPSNHVPAPPIRRSCAARGPLPPPRVPPPPSPTPRPSPTLPPCPPKRAQTHGPRTRQRFFCLSKSRAWKAPSQLRIRNPNRIPAPICTRIRFPAVAEGTSAPPASTCRGNPRGCPPTRTRITLMPSLSNHHPQSAEDPLTLRLSKGEPGGGNGRGVPPCLGIVFHAPSAGPSALSGIRFAHPLRGICLLSATDDSNPRLRHNSKLDPPLKGSLNRHNSKLPPFHRISIPQSGQRSLRHGEAAKKRSDNSIQLKPCPPACYNDPSASSGPPTRRWHT